jgi:hypothetical protein
VLPDRVRKATLTLELKRMFDLLQWGISKKRAVCHPRHLREGRSLTFGHRDQADSANLAKLSTPLFGGSHLSRGRVTNSNTAPRTRQLLGRLSNDVRNRLSARINVRRMRRFHDCRRRARAWIIW